MSGDICSIMPLLPPNAFANIMSMSHLSSCATHESRRFADQPSHDEYCHQAFSRFRIRRWHFEVFQKVTCFGMTHFEKPSLATMTEWLLLKTRHQIEHLIIFYRITNSSQHGKRRSQRLGRPLTRESLPRCRQIRS